MNKRNLDERLADRYKTIAQVKKSPNRYKKEGRDRFHYTIKDIAEINKAKRKINIEDDINKKKHLQNQFRNWFENQIGKQINWHKLKEKDYLEKRLSWKKIFKTFSFT